MQSYWVQAFMTWVQAGRRRVVETGWLRSVVRSGPYEV